MDNLFPCIIDIHFHIGHMLFQHLMDSTGHLLITELDEILQQLFHQLIFAEPVNKIKAGFLPANMNDTIHNIKVFPHRQGFFHIFHVCAECSCHLCLCLITQFKNPQSALSMAEIRCFYTFKSVPSKQPALPKKSVQAAHIPSILIQSVSSYFQTRLYAPCPCHHRWSGHIPGKFPG